MPDRRPGRARPGGAPLAAVAFPSFLLVLAAAAAPAGSRGPVLVSVDVDGNDGNGNSYLGAVTPNGRFVAFHGNADDLVPGDGNDTHDVFVRDLRAGTTSRVSVATDGTEGNGVSSSPSLSANGRFVVFQSSASNLVSPDANGSVRDILMHDRKTGETTRVSDATDGTQGSGSSYVSGASISANGRWVTFSSISPELQGDGGNTAYQVFVHDRKTGETRRVSGSPAGGPADADCETPSLSSSGRSAVFYSAAGNLGADPGNGSSQVFLHDLRTGTTIRVSEDTAGNPGIGESVDPVVTPNGRLVAFQSDAGNLLVGDTNGVADVFVRDLRTGETRRVSVTSDGAEVGGRSSSPALSSSGRRVAFNSFATDLVPGDTNGVGDVFLSDLQTGAIRFLSADAQGTVGNGNSSLYAPSLSSNGKFLVFYSEATNLVTPDGNGNNSDVFLLDLR